MNSHFLILLLLGSVLVVLPELCAAKCQAGIPGSQQRPYQHCWVCNLLAACWSLPVIFALLTPKLAHSALLSGYVPSLPTLDFHLDKKA